MTIETETLTLPYVEGRGDANSRAFLELRHYLTGKEGSRLVSEESLEAHECHNIDRYHIHLANGVSVVASCTNNYQDLVRIDQNNGRTTPGRSKHFAIKSRERSRTNDYRVSVRLSGEEEPLRETVLELEEVLGKAGTRE